MLSPWATPIGHHFWASKGISAIAVQKAGRTDVQLRLCLAPEGTGEPVKATYDSASSKGLICAIDGDCTGLETEEHSGQGDVSRADGVPGRNQFRGSEPLRSLSLTWRQLPQLPERSALSSGNGLPCTKHPCLLACPPYPLPGRSSGSGRLGG